MLKYKILFFACLFITTMHGQVESILISDDFKRFEFVIDNDVFNNTDYYYTEGFELKYSSPKLSNSFLFALFSTPDKKQYDRYGIGAEHRMYTPIDKNNSGDLDDDRPFSSYFLINIHKETRKYISKSTNYFQIGIGFLGNISGGKEIQNFIHKLLPKTNIVKGWDSQISNKFLIDANYIYEKGIVHSKYFDMMILARGQAGTLRNNLGIGSHIRVGWMPDYYQNIGRNNRLGNGLYIFSEINWNSRWVIYDTTLQGGIFNNNEDTYVLLASEIETFVHQIDASLNLRYKRLQISLVQTFLSREIKNGLSHKYGSLKASFDF